jgi:ribosomal protein S5
MVKATIQALSELREPERVAALRGKQLSEIR